MQALVHSSSQRIVPKFVVFKKDIFYFDLKFEFCTQKLHLRRKSLVIQSFTIKKLNFTAEFKVGFTHQALAKFGR